MFRVVMLSVIDVLFNVWTLTAMCETESFVSRFFRVMASA